jgi:light-regulated signal transduction histidine kinase (bacteriophytochrome)
LPQPGNFAIAEFWATRMLELERTETQIHGKSQIMEADAKVYYEKLPHVRVPDVHLQQLFQNFIGNAIKYGKDDDPPRIHIAAQRNENDWLFSVRDNGIGILPDRQEQVFGTFKRLHNGETVAGTGIGLAICKRIVERNGGRIWVESAGTGKGSTFYVTLPAGGAR